MIGNLYNYVMTNILGTVPLEFEFIGAVITILIVFCMLYAVFAPFLLLKDFFD